MLVTFTCPAHADITYLGEVATQLLKLMGHSGKIPSALNAEDIPAALEKLEAAVEVDQQIHQQQRTDQTEDDEPAVSLAHRALPLVELLKAAAKDECHVMWGSPR